MGEFKEKLIRSRAIWFLAGSLGAITLSNVFFDRDNESSLKSDIPAGARPEDDKKIPFRSGDCERFKLNLFAKKLGEYIDDGSGELNYYIEHSGTDDLDPADNDDREQPILTLTSILDEGRGERSWFIQNTGEHNITYRERSSPFDKFSMHINVRGLTASGANITGYACNDNLRNETQPQFDPETEPTQRANALPTI